ncbi:MAG: HupE/UreJ family protein [Bryobacteraceae bacterium]
MSRLLVFAVLLASASPVRAHDIPSDVTVTAFAAASGSTLRLLVRMPLRAVRDIDFPERADGYLDLDKLDPLLPGIVTQWIASPIEIRSGGDPLEKPRVAAARISIPADRSFREYNAALAHLAGPPIASAETLVWNQVNLDALLEYTLPANGSALAIRPRFDHLAARVTTSLRFLATNGVVRAYEFHEDPGLVPLDPSWTQAARRFLALGFHHILDGMDHLLFLACLVIPLRRFVPLALAVTAFTAAHSITLAAAAFDLAPSGLWFPPMVETAIAASILWMAIENIVGRADAAHRATMAFAFGLIHGFGFSFALKETLQFAGAHLAASLAAFNAGVELGQLTVLALILPALWALFRWVLPERAGTAILSVLIAHTAWHWLADRAALLAAFRIGLTPAETLRALLFLMMFGGSIWVANQAARRLSSGEPPPLATDNPTAAPCAPPEA